MTKLNSGPIDGIENFILESASNREYWIERTVYGSQNSVILWESFRSIVLNINKITDCISLKDFKSLISSDAWINMKKSQNIGFYNYKMPKHYNSLQIRNDFKVKYMPIDDENLSFFIEQICNAIIAYNHPWKDHVVKGSKGLLLLRALRACEDSSIREMSIRGLKSKDHRVRALSTKLCPVDKVEAMLLDKRKPVRQAAIKRLGIHNVADKLLKDPAMDIRMDAAISVGDSKVIADIIEKDKNSLGRYSSWTAAARIARALKNMTKKEIIYNLDLANVSSSWVNDIVRMKIQ